MTAQPDPLNGRWLHLPDAPHECRLPPEWRPVAGPAGTSEDQGTTRHLDGTVWQCNECGRVWRFTLDGWGLTRRRKWRKIAQQTQEPA